MLRFCLIWTVLIIGFCASGVAQNLIDNADFHTGPELWSDTPPNLVIVRDSSDWLDDPGSGSAEITNSAPTNYNAGVWQCVSDGVMGGELYDFGAWTRVPTGQSEVGNAYLLGIVYDGDNCSGSQIDWPNSNAISTSDTWVPIRRNDYLMPVAGRSVRFSLGVSKLSANGSSLIAYFDGVYLIPDGTLFWNDFESGTVVPWSESLSP